jgi:hypothetical protein
VLLRLAYLGVTNTLALLRLLPMSDRAKDAEILALRHQTTVLERHLHGEDPLHLGRAGLARRPAPPTPPRPTPGDPAAGPPRDRAALAPCPDRATARQDLPAYPSRAAANYPVDPPAGVAPGRRERLVGVSQDPRRVARAGCHGRRLDRVGNPPHGRHRSGTSAHQRHLGDVPAPADRERARPAPSPPFSSYSILIGRSRNTLADPCHVISAAR